MKLNLPLDLSNLESGDNLTKWLSQCIKQITTAINGKIAIDENLDVSFLNLSFSKANTSIAFNHKLGRAPQGYIITKMANAMIIFDGGSANTGDVIYLQASAVGSATVMLF